MMDIGEAAYVIELGRIYVVFQAQARQDETIHLKTIFLTKNKFADLSFRNSYYKVLSQLLIDTSCLPYSVI